MALIKLYHFVDADYYDLLGDSIPPYVIDKKGVTELIIKVTPDPYGIWLWIDDVTEDLLTDFFTFKMLQKRTKRGYLLECIVNETYLLNYKLRQLDDKGTDYVLTHRLHELEHGKILHDKVKFDILINTPIPKKDVTILYTIENRIIKNSIIAVK